MGIEFKKQVVEELISGSSRPSQICRRYNVGCWLFLIL